MGDGMGKDTGVQLLQMRMITTLKISGEPVIDHVTEVSVIFTFNFKLLPYTDFIAKSYIWNILQGIVKQYLGLRWERSVSSRSDLTRMGTIQRGAF